jgi:hypothetical protein
MAPGKKRNRVLSQFSMDFLYSQSNVFHLITNSGIVIRDRDGALLASRSDWCLIGGKILGLTGLSLGWVMAIYIEAAFMGKSVLGRFSVSL